MSNTHTAEPGMLEYRVKNELGGWIGRDVSPGRCVRAAAAPVGRCGEQAQDDVAALHAYDAAGGVQEVEVEVGIARHGAVEPRLQEGGPLLLQDALGAAQVGLAHAGHPGHHHLEEEQRREVGPTDDDGGRNRVKKKKKKQKKQVRPSPDDETPWPSL